MNLLDAILPGGEPEPCAAPGAFVIRYAQSGTDAWVARCYACGGMVKHDAKAGADELARTHNETGGWDVSG